MAILELFRGLIALAVEFVTQGRVWKEIVKRRNHSDAQYAEFRRSWSTRAERELQEMDYMFRGNRRHLGGRMELQEMQICHWQTLSKHQPYRHEEASVQRTPRRRIMVVNNPDPIDDSDEEFGMKIRI